MKTVILCFFISDTTECMVFVCLVVFLNLIFLPCLFDLQYVPHNISEDIPVKEMVLTLSGKRGTETQ